jgi:hypothetical protein
MDPAFRINPALGAVVISEIHDGGSNPLLQMIEHPVDPIPDESIGVIVDGEIRGDQMDLHGGLLRVGVSIGTK